MNGLVYHSGFPNRGVIRSDPCFRKIIPEPVSRAILASGPYQKTRHLQTKSRNTAKAFRTSLRTSRLLLPNYEVCLCSFLTDIHFGGACSRRKSLKVVIKITVIII